MNLTHVAKLMQLDPEGVDGTLQSLLMDCKNFDETSFEDFLYRAVGAMMRDKQGLIKDNIRLSKELNDGKV